MSHKFDGDDRRLPAEGGWHLDKGVPLSLIFAMLVQAGMGIWAIADIKKDVEVLKAGSLVLQDRDTRHDIDLRDALYQVREQIKSLDDKLSRMLERNQK